MCKFFVPTNNTPIRAFGTNVTDGERLWSRAELAGFCQALKHTPLDPNATVHEARQRHAPYLERHGAVTCALNPDPRAL